MPLGTLYPYPYTLPRVGNVTPFTYRTGASYLEILETLSHYVREVLLPALTAETSAVNEQLETLLTSYVDDIDRRIMLINNRVGGEPTVRRTIGAPLTVTVDNAWPDAHPIDFQIRQNNVGTYPITFGPGITGTVTTNTNPNGLTEFTLIPTGPNAWYVSQLPRTTAAFNNQVLALLTAPLAEQTRQVNASLDAVKAQSTERKFSRWGGVSTAMERWSSRLLNINSAPVVWVNTGSSTAAGGTVQRNNQSWFPRLGEMMGQVGGQVDLANITAANIPATGWFGVKSAVGGTNSGNFMSQADIDKVISLNPAIISVCIGSNDWSLGVAPDVYENNLRNVVGQYLVKTPNTVILLMHQQGRSDGGTRAYPWQSYGNVMKKLAKEHPDQILYLDMDQYFKFMGIPGLNPWGIVHPDRIHLNQFGHKIFAEIVSEYMGLPSTRYMEHETYEAATFAGGDFTVNENNNAIATIGIPPKPYIRQLRVFATVYGRVNTGFGDVVVQLDDSLNTESVIAMRIASLSSETSFLSRSYTIEPGASGNLRLVSSISGSNTVMTISSARAYMAFGAELKPGV